MAWTERADKYHHGGSYQPEGMAIHEQLAKIGYSCADVDKVIFTHMHWDHIYYMEKFTKAQFIAAARIRVCSGSDSALLQVLRAPCAGYCAVRLKG